MKFEFAQAAREEFLENSTDYELQQSSLGMTFSEKGHATTERVLEFSKGWTSWDDTFHRCLIQQFSPARIYTILDQKLIITSAMNLRRKPDYGYNRERI